MKVLILSCNTGGGHNAAGRAIRECFEGRDIPCDLVDTLSFTSRSREEFICKGHVFAYRNMPQLYGAGYRYAETHHPKKKKSLVYRSNIDYSDRILEFIREQGYDTVICVHVFAAAAMSEILLAHPGFVRAYFVATDYTCSPGVGDTDLDGYFIPHPALRGEFVRGGLPADRLIATGIPVRTAFCERHSAAEAKKRLGLPADRRVLLMMCGSMGCGPMRELTEECLARLPADGLLVAVCGDNRKLYEELGALAGPNLLVVGFTAQVDVYMDAAELFISKAGGLSSSEAAAKGLPIVFIDAVPGCESKNLDFFCQNGYAISARKTEELAALACSLLDDPAQREKMTKALKSTFPNRSADRLADYVVRGTVCAGETAGETF